MKYKKISLKWQQNYSIFLKTKITENLVNFFPHNVLTQIIIIFQGLYRWDMFIHTKHYSFTQKIYYYLYRHILCNSKTKVFEMLCMLCYIPKTECISIPLGWMYCERDITTKNLQLRNKVLCCFLARSRIIFLLHWTLCTNFTLCLLKKKIYNKTFYFFM